MVNQYLTELKFFLRLSLPITLVLFLLFLPIEITIAFAGHLGKDELDAAGLANSIFQIWAVAIMNGVSYATNSLFAQAYSSKNLEVLRIQFQRTILISIVFFFILILPLCVNSEFVLVLAGQERVHSHLAGLMLLIFLPGLFSRFIFCVVIKFLEGQNVTFINNLSLFLVDVISLGMNPLLIYWFKWGFLGALFAS